MEFTTRRLLAENTFSFEDLPNGGDEHYIDLNVKVDPTVLRILVYYLIVNMGILFKLPILKIKTNGT